MSQIETVLGPISTDQLGFTLCHEHVGTNAAGIRQIYPEFIDPGLEDQSVKALSEAREEGLKTIVDLTTIDLGRDINLIKRVSERTGVQIIAATGNHLAVPRPFGDVHPSVLSELYIRELRTGIEGTNIKAGIIKVASDAGGVTQPQEIVLRAAALTHLETEAPISTHTWSPDKVGLQQIRILKEEGVDLSKVYIGHSNDDTDISYLHELLNSGVWIGLDRYPGGVRAGTPDWEKRTEIVKQLIDDGYVNRMILSHDYSVPKARHGVEAQEARQRANPDGYNFITRKVLPRLLYLGVSQSDIDTMMIQNPKRFLEGG
ncbi:MAG: phosphotriesterase-related protein [Dehalococcoidia bacterium]|nr:phosphotriesterase-related protein [Dehalococcoidia bacterium]